MSADDGLPDTTNSLQVSFDEFEVLGAIGKGSYGSVLKADYLGTIVAVKQLDLEEVGEEDVMKYIGREEAMTSYAHPNLVQFIGKCRHGKNLYILTEFVSRGDLRSILKDTATELPWKWRLNVALDVACGMAFLHSKRIMHRDLKSKNILVDVANRSKVCDFGFARTFGARKRLYTCCGTEDWMAPEVILGMEYSENSDVFSYGIVLAELITRKKTSRELQRGPQDCFEFNNEAFEEFLPEDCPPAFAEITKQCCAYEPDERPSFLEIVRKLKEIMQELDDTEVRVQLASVDVIPTTPARSSELSTPKGRPKTLAKLKGQSRRFSWFKRSVSFHEQTLERMKAVESMGCGLSIPDSAGFVEAVNRCLSPSVESAWVLLGYEGKKALKVQAEGNEIEDLVEHLNEDELQYSLVRVRYTKDSSEGPAVHLMRDVFVQWIGARVPPLFKGQSMQHSAEVKKIFEPIHAELTAVSKERFTLENILDKSGPLSGSHVID